MYPYTRWTIDLPTTPSVLFSMFDGNKCFWGYFSSDIDCYVDICIYLCSVVAIQTSVRSFDDMYRSIYYTN